MTDGGQCVIMGLLSLLQSWQRGGVEEKQSIPDGRATAAQECTEDEKWTK